MAKRALSLLVAVALLWASVPAVSYGASSLPEKLSQLEDVIFGRDRADTGSLVERVEALERELYGSPERGPLLARVEDMYELLIGGGTGRSLLLRLNAIEWMLYQEVTQKQPIGRRIERLEAEVLGERKSGPIEERVSRLMDLVWPGGSLNLGKVQVPEATLVYIRLLGEVNSAQNRVGEAIPYRVARDVMVDDRLVIPAGTESEARVTKVESAGALGKSGRVELDFGTVTALDGTKIRLQVDEKSAKQNTELAAAASVGGLVLLGPIGLVGGVFVRGSEHVIPVGTEFYVEVDRAVEAQGLALKPTGL